MAVKYVVEIDLTAKSDDAVVRQLEQSLTRLNATATKAKGGIAGLASSIKDSLGGAIAGLIGTGALAKFLSDGIRASIQAERTFRVLADSVRSFGQNGDEAVAATKALGDALQRVGFDDDEIAAGVQQLVELTKDYKQAVSGASLAADIAAKKNIAYSEALGVVQGLLFGSQRGVIGAQKMFNTTAHDAQGILDELQKKIGGYALTLSDTQSKLEAAKQELNDFGKEIGGPLSQALVWLIARVKDIGHAFGALGLATYQTAERVVLGVQTIATVFEKFDIRRPIESVKWALVGMGDEWTHLLDTQRDQWEAWQEDVERTAAALDTQKQKLIAGTGGRGGEGDDAARKARLKALMQASQDRLRVAEEERKRQSAVNKGLLDEFLAAEDVKQQEVDESLEREREAMRRKAELRDEDIQDAIRAEQIKLQAQQTVAGLAMQLGSTMFGENKAWAAAEALINTYLGATQALKAYPPPYSFVAAALVIANGLAQVAKIKSTNKGASGGYSSISGGGSQPSTPPTVYHGRSGRGTGGTGASQTTINTTRNEGAQVVNVNALTGTQAAAALNEFERMRRPAGRSVDRTYATRPATKAGVQR